MGISPDNNLSSDGLPLGGDVFRDWSFLREKPLLLVEDTVGKDMAVFLGQIEGAVLAGDATLVSELLENQRPTSLVARAMAKNWRVDLLEVNRVCYRMANVAHYLSSEEDVVRPWGLADWSRHLRWIAEMAARYLDWDEEGIAREDAKWLIERYPGDARVEVLDIVDSRNRVSAVDGEGSALRWGEGGVCTIDGMYEAMSGGGVGRSDTDKMVDDLLDRGLLECHLCEFLMLSSRGRLALEKVILRKCEAELAKSAGEILEWREWSVIVKKEEEVGLNQEIIKDIQQVFFKKGELSLLPLDRAA